MVVNHADTVKPRRQREKYINSYPNYKVDIEDEGETFNVHFVALFSKKQDAVPLLMMHGWPGSFSHKPGNLFGKYLELLLTGFRELPRIP